jgi:hypothetical protein
VIDIIAELQVSAEKPEETIRFYEELVRIYNENCVGKMDSADMMLVLTMFMHRTAFDYFTTECYFNGMSPERAAAFWKSVESDSEAMAQGLHNAAGRFLPAGLGVLTGGMVRFIEHWQHLQRNCDCEFCQKRRAEEAAREEPK